MLPQCLSASYHDDPERVLNGWKEEKLHGHGPLHAHTNIVLQCKRGKAARDMHSPKQRWSILFRRVHCKSTRILLAATPDRVAT
jgi:hypothetical protein